MYLLKPFLFLMIMQPTLSSQVDPAVEVMEADKKLNQLIIQNNAEAAQAFYTDDFILITAAGSTKTKKDIVTEIGLPNLKIEINETTQVNVRVYRDVAVLTGVLLQKGVYNGKPFDVKLLVTDTWINTKFGWKILSGHASKLPSSNP